MRRPQQASEELDKAKKDLAEIRAKSGSDDDAKPDLERLMEQERKVVVSSQAAERLLIKAQRNGVEGNMN